VSLFPSNLTISVEDLAVFQWCQNSSSNLPSTVGCILHFVL